MAKRENLISKCFDFGGDWQTPAGRYKVIKQCETTGHCDAVCLSSPEGWAVGTVWEGFFPSIAKRGCTSEGHHNE